MDLLKSINVGYSLVVGVMKGVSSKSGKPYEMFSLVTRINDKDSNCKVETVFNFDVGKFPVGIGDKVMFLYSGNGNFKNIVQVLKQKD